MDCETDGVVPNRLCGNCARIVGKSKIIQQFIVTDSDQLRDLNIRKGPAEKEVFFHSPKLETIMSSVASGCHLCSIVSWGEDKYFRPKDSYHQPKVTRPKVKLRDLAILAELFRDNRGETFSQHENSSGIIQVSVTEAWSSGHTIMSFDILTDLQMASECQMGDYEQMDSVLNDRFRGLQGWERWRGGKSLGVISLRKANGLVSPPSTSGSGPNLPISTDSPESVATLRYWLNECLQNHPECQSPFKTAGSGKLPTRLIDVGEAEGSLLPRLVETGDFRNRDERRYLTLSHCWGDLNMDIKLTKDSYTTFLEHGIPVESLRRTLRDAMDITRRLGYRYIWIDSLCIIQDSPEDWAEEALTMKDVYGNTSCNIAALGEPGDSCFVKRNPLHFFPCYIGVETPNSKDSVYAFRHYSPSLNSKEDHKGGPPLLRRGWVVQEKLLSTRVIYMGIPQLHWECARHTLSEGLPVMQESSSSVPFYNQLVCAKSDFRALRGQTLESGGDKLQHEAQNMIDLSKCWMRMVSDYSKMNFTKKEDRFIAFAGVAEAIAVGRGWTYVAGTWKEFWPFDLLWARYEPAVPRKAIYTHHRSRKIRKEEFLKSKPLFPSWSWARKLEMSNAEVKPAMYFLPSRYQHLFDPVTLRLTLTYLATVIDFSCPDFMTQHSSTGAKYGDIKLSLRGKVLNSKVSADYLYSNPSALMIRIFGGTSGRVHWDVDSFDGNGTVRVLMLMGWMEFGEEQQAGLVLLEKPLAPFERVMYLRVGVWEDYSPQPRRGRRLVFPPSVEEKVVHLC